MAQLLFFLFFAHIKMQPPCDAVVSNKTSAHVTALHVPEMKHEQIIIKTDSNINHLYIYVSSHEI